MKYKIGDWVRVKAQMVVEYEDDKRKLVSAPCDAVGQVCGAVRRQEGVVTYYPSYSGMYDDDPPDPETACLNVTGTHRLYQVRQGMLNRPIEARERDLEAIPPGKLPVLYNGEWTDQGRKIASEESKNWPRDARGRWI